MNSWLTIILLIIILSFTLETVLSILNIKVLSPVIPPEFEDIYNKNDYTHSQEYTKTTTSWSLIENSLTTIIIICFLLFGGFNSVDIWARHFGFGEIPTGLIYIAVLITFSFFISLPFSLYSTFVIEEQFGFNNTTAKTYILDILKSIFLAACIGIPVLIFILWFFISSGPEGWLFCWLGVALLTLILQFVTPILIMPLFNTFFPLENGPLHTKILAYIEKETFTIQGIYTMDGSKRSSKVNAFFTGFGRFRKIVFFDTLIEKLGNNEIIAVLAHEIGHFKQKHLVKMILASILQTGFTFYLLSLFIGNKFISEAFQMEHTSIYASLVFFGFVYSPINLVISQFFNTISRKHEFEADEYAAKTLNTPLDLISSLKKLSQANLNNLTPHPLYVFFYYSHPPILQRIQRLLT